MSRLNEQQEQALAAGLKALDATTRDLSASRSVESAVLAEMRRRHPARGERNRAWLAVAAALLVATGVGAWFARIEPPRRAVIHPAGFIEVPGAWVLPPMESGSIVRVALDVGELPAYGLQIVPDFGIQRVEADLLVAQDGLPRAIRLVDDTHTSRSTP